MDFTRSFERQLPAEVVARYEFAEVRNASGVLAAAAPDELSSIVATLREFRLTATNLLTPGGSEGLIAKELNQHLRNDGWREARVDVVTKLDLRLSPHGPSEKLARIDTSTEVRSEGYKVDNFRGRVALDVEWNAKDGNLDRDLAAYRSLYDLALIDAAVLITRTHDDLRVFAQNLAVAGGMDAEGARRVLNTSTTTNLQKLRPRLSRGDAGGCPVLAVAICEATSRG
jgi:hypothetical protein